MWSLDGTALDLVQKTWYDHPFNTGIGLIDEIFPDGIKSRSVLEVYGDVESPKSLVIQHLCVSYVLHDPRAQVHYFDHESMIDMNEIERIIIERITDEEYDIKSILDRFHIYRCESTTSWSNSMNTLHNMLLAQTDIHLLVAIDCIGSYHHIDKMMQYRLQDTSYKKPVTIYTQLKNMIRKHSATVFVAKNNESEMGWKHTEYLPSEWTNLVTKRLHVRLQEANSNPTYDLKVDHTVRSFQIVNHQLTPVS